MIKKITTGFIAVIVILSLNIPIVQASIVHNNNILNHSWLRLDFDGVDEAGKSGNDPTGYTNTVGSMCSWVVFDTVLGADGTRVIWGAGGDDTDQATAFGQIIVDLRRQASLSVTNRIEVLHRADGSGTVNRVAGGTTISAGTLYHICVTTSGTAWKIYLNGTAETLTTLTGSNTGDWVGDMGTVGTRHHAIGNAWRDGAWGVSWFDGKIDDTFITSTELSATDITNLHNGGKPIHPCAVIACSNVNIFWKLGEDSPSTVTTMHSARGTTSTDNMTMENMESADIVTTSYY